MDAVEKGVYIVLAFAIVLSAFTIGYTIGTMLDHPDMVVIDHDHPNMDEMDEDEIEEGREHGQWHKHHKPEK